MKDTGDTFDERTRIEKLREMIDNKNYLDEAIHRIAQVLSNEITEDTVGVYHEQ